MLLTLWMGDLMIFGLSLYATKTVNGRPSELRNSFYRWRVAAGLAAAVLHPYENQKGEHDLLDTASSASECLYVGNTPLATTSSKLLAPAGCWSCASRAPCRPASRAGPRLAWIRLCPDACRASQGWGNEKAACHRTISKRRLEARG